MKSVKREAFKPRSPASSLAEADCQRWIGEAVPLLADSARLPAQRC